MSDHDLKACTKCGGTKSASEFRERKYKDGTRGATSWCRECLNAASKQIMRERGLDPVIREQGRERDRARYARLKDDSAFREKERARAREYCARPDVKKRVSERSKDWAAANPERVRELHQRWSKANAEKVQEYTRDWRNRNRADYLLGHVVAQGKRRWRMYNQGAGLLTKLQGMLCHAYWGGKCAYCAGDLPALVPGKALTALDHVVPLSLGGGHGPENVVACCKPCNDRKNNRLLPDHALDLLQRHVVAFLDMLPPEAAWSRRSAVPSAIREACLLAKHRMQGIGAAVGTFW
jgi:5-methylcytosine-specific restriction endonuclease McrA